MDISHFHKDKPADDIIEASICGLKYDLDKIRTEDLEKLKSGPSQLDLISDDDEESYSDQEQDLCIALSLLDRVQYFLINLDMYEVKLGPKLTTESTLLWNDIKDFVDQFDNQRESEK